LFISFSLSYSRDFILSLVCNSKINYDKNYLKKQIEYKNIMDVPDNFRSTIMDMTNDLTTTFPEYAFLWSKWKNSEQTSMNELYKHCMGVFPERFFDILYQNDDIFKPDDETNTVFLPNVDFKLLFNCNGVSETTKKTIWKYLQLILFITVGSIDDKTKFGDSANLFDGIDEKVLQDKLEETMTGISDFFKNMEKEPSNETETGTELPNVDDIHSHLKGIFDGKIGKLAKEMAEEISGEFVDLVGDVADGENTTQDVIKKLMKNPKKMMGLVKTVGDKLTTKMDSGEISKDDIMKEAGDILGKMKEMGGGNQISELLKTFAGGMGKNMKVDMNAITRMTTQSETKERLKKKMEANKAAREATFSIPGVPKQERSAIQQSKMDDALINEIGSSVDKKKKKKSKK
jgi:hypothetical protein